MLRKKSVILTWVLSYITILFVPIFIGVLIQLRIEKIVESEINNSNSFYLRQVKQYMDDIASDIEKLSTEIAFSLRVQEVIGFRPPISDEERYRILECIRELKGLRISRSSIHSFYLYFKNSDMVMNDVSALESEEFYQVLFKNKNEMDYAPWMDMLQKYYKGVYLPLPVKENAKADSGKSIFYLRSLPLVAQGDIQANIVFSIDESRFLEMGRDIGNINKGRILIVGKDDTVIADSGEQKVPEVVTYQNLAGKNGLLYGKQGNEEVIVSYIDSDKTNWKYVYIMPTSVYWEKLEYTRKLTYLSVLLCIMLGSGLAALLLKRNYAPVQRLINSLPKSQQGCFTAESNEYSLIQNAIRKTVDDKEEIHRKLVAQNNLLKARFIERLLKGNVSQSIISEAFTSFDIAFESGTFGVMLFYIKDFSGFVGENDEYDYYESSKLFQFIMTNVLEEVVGRKNLGFVTEMNGDIVCLINFRTECAGREKTEMVSIAQEVEQFIDSNFKVKLTTAISNIHETVIGISQAYNEAVGILEYKLVMGVDQILTYDQAKGKGKGEYYYPIEKEQQLLNSIKAGDYERSKQLLDEIFERHFGGSDPALHTAGYAVFNMAGTLLRAAYEISDSSGNDFREQLNRIEELVHYKKLSKVKEEVLDIVKVFCEYTQSKKGSTGPGVAAGVKEYVLSNYADENISISTIAEKVYLHPAYVSKLFKDQEGIGILEYINNIRIEKAMLLMKDRKHNLEDIAKQVGYTNVRTFSRAFIKMHGITPGKYREMLQA